MRALIPPFHFTGRAASRSRKHWYFLSCLLLFLFLLCSCGATGATPKAAATKRALAIPTDLVTPHVLTVGSYINYVPQEFYDATTHKAVGFDIELITAIAQRLGLQVTIVDTDFSQLIDHLNSRQFDLAISAISIISELQSRASFVPYFRGGASLLVPKGNPQHISSLDQLCGLKVAVGEQTFEQSDLANVSETCLEDGQAAITVIARSALSDSVQLLASGAVAATYQNAAQSDYYVQQQPKLFEVGGDVIDQNTEGIAVRKSDSSMLAAVQGAFQALVADGSYQTIIKRWGLVSGDITKPASPS